MLQQAVYATKLQKKMATGDHLPTLSVGAAAYHMNPLEKNIDGTNNAMLFATLSVPISDWWGGSHVSREKELKYQIAQNNLNDTKELLSLQMNKLWLDVNDAYDRITLLEENQLQINENLKLHRGSYENGLTSLSDLLEAQAMATEQQVKLIEAKQVYRLAVLQYLNSTSRKMEE
jgi:outer membrane protein TolC